MARLLEIKDKKEPTYFLFYETRHNGYRASLSNKSEAEIIAKDEDNMDVFPCKTFDFWPPEKEYADVDEDNLGEMCEKLKPWEINMVDIKFNVREELVFIKK